jgi:host factor-I protein
MGVETSQTAFHTFLCGAGAPQPWREWHQRPGNNIRRGHHPMASERQNLQDAFLNYVRKNKTPVTVFLINGVKLQGVITWFDNFCVLLRRDGQSQLVYKHAISTIMPGQPINLYEAES